MVELNDVIEIKIETMASSGLGVGFYEADTKRAIFVPYSCPGDILKVKIIKQEKVYFEAEIVEIINKSESRIKPICEHYGICGGCNWLHIDYKMQIKQKEIILKYLFEKVKIDLPEIKIIPSQKILNYRDKVKTQENGFYKKSTNEIVPINQCHIINENFNEIVFKSKDNLFVFDYKHNRVTTKKAYYDFQDLWIKHHPNGFVQSNLTTNKKLIQTVLQEINEEKVLELYAGNGNFTIPLSKKIKKITAVEGDGLGSALLKENCVINQSNNIKVIKNDAIEFTEISKAKWDCVLIDPPRSGSKNLLEKLNTNKVIYVSCNPNQAIKEAKKYKWDIQKVYLIDMFPQTQHFECVFVLKK